MFVTARLHVYRHSCIITPEVLSEAALEQRLRRKCAAGKKRKNPGAEDAIRLYQDLDNRPRLMDMLIQSNFNQLLQLHGCGM